MESCVSMFRCLLLLVVLSATPACSSHRADTRQAKAAAWDNLANRFSAHNHRRYLIQYRGGLSFDSARQQWHGRIVFLSGGGGYEAWLDKSGTTVVEEYFIDEAGRRRGTLEELFPADYPTTN